MIVGALFLINIKFDKIDAKFEKIDAKFEKIESSLEYIKARVDEHTFYDSSRISVLKFVTSHYKICNVGSVLHFVRFEHGNQVLSGGITIAHSLCALGIPDKPVLDCGDLDISIVPMCPPEGI